MNRKLIVAVGAILVIGLLVYMYSASCRSPSEDYWKAIYPNTNWASGSVFVRAPVTNCECQNLIKDSDKAVGGVFDSDHGVCYAKRTMGNSSRVRDAASRYTAYVKHPPSSS